jgi:hypothetical protein
VFDWHIIWRPQRAALRKNHDPHKNHDPCNNHYPRKTAIHPYNLPSIVGRASVPALKKPLCLAIPRRAGLPARCEKKTMKRNRMHAITHEAVNIDDSEKKSVNRFLILFFFIPFCQNISRVNSSG